MIDCLPRVLLNRRFCSRLRTLASSTRSTVFQLPPRSTIEIFSGLRTFSSSLFFWSSRSGTACPPSHRRLSSLQIFGLQKSQISTLVFFPILPMSESSNSWIYFHLSTPTMDGSNDFGTSGLRKVRSPGHFQGFRPRALSLGSNDCWSSRSDLTAQI
jgi:hypothetical protein